MNAYAYIAWLVLSGALVGGPIWVSSHPLAVRQAQRACQRDPRWPVQFPSFSGCACRAIAAQTAADYPEFSFYGALRVDVHRTYRVVCLERRRSTSLTLTSIQDGPTGTPSIAAAGRWDSRVAPASCQRRSHIDGHSSRSTSHWRLTCICAASAGNSLLRKDRR